MGAKSYAGDYLMNADGMTYYTNQDFNTWKYKDVFSKVHFTNIGLQMNLNVNNFFGPNRGNRRWTVLLSPAVYAQHFSTELINKADKSPGNLITQRHISPYPDVPLIRLFSR